jgi:hypothetical protein
MMLSQSFAQKMEENPDYYNNRYSDPNKRRLADAKNIYFEKAVMYARYHLAQPNFDGKSLNIDPGSSTFESPLSYTDRDVYDCATAFAKMRLDKVREEIKEKKQPSNVYEVPVLDRMMLHAGKDVEKIPKLKQEDRSLFESYSSFVIASSVLARSNKNMQGMKEADLIHDMDAVYVDGKPFTEFLKEKFPDKDPVDELNHNILANLMLNPRHRVDVVHSYRDENGVMQYEAKTLKAAITPEQEKLYLKQFNWIHRTFFNRGRFWIEPLKDQLDRIVTDPNDPEVKERYEKICAHMKERVETGIAKKEEAARLSKEKDAEQARWRETYKTETERMRNAVDHSAEEYGANSVIGILGQQVKQSYDDIIKKVSNPVKYETVAEVFAKQVLFTLLCTERVSKDGEIGPREQALMGETEEATQKKIETVVKDMAKDPVLKESLFKMVGDANEDNKTVSREAVKQMMLNGGCRALTTAYNEQKMAEQAQNKQSEGISNQVSVQQQGLENAQPSAPEPPKPAAVP